MPHTSIVIPVRRGGDPYIPLRSLREQLAGCEVIVQHDDDLRGANWARNAGARLARASKYLLFSDDDIAWSPGALSLLQLTLAGNPSAAYAYGSYRITGSPDPSRVGRVFSDRWFDASSLRRGNYISTMALIRRDRFPGFDESIARLQDWDLWLTMLAAGDVGVYCCSEVFTTEERNGITVGNPLSYNEAKEIVRKKHRL